MVWEYHSAGKEKFQIFMKSLLQGEQAFYQPIKRNKVLVFEDTPVQRSSKVKAIKDDCHIFSCLFISCQSRQCDLKAFFEHENPYFPPSLSDNGKLHTCQKSQLTDLLEDQIKLPDTQPEADAIIIDGSAMVYSIKPNNCKTFDDYAEEDILPKIKSYCTKYKRVDIIHDVYSNDSLQQEARVRRGMVIWRRVMSTTKTPSNWQSFLRDSDNKTELFSFIAFKNRM